MGSQNLGICSLLGPIRAPDIKWATLAGSGTVEPRPGVIRLYEEAREAGLKVAVCSAATKSSVILVLENLLGPERFKVRVPTLPRTGTSRHVLVRPSN